MPDTSFIIWLDGQTRILVHRTTDRGRYASFAVVLTVLSPLGWIDVGRFDTAHGVPHRDILGHRAGLLQKVWYDDISPKRVFHLAIETFRSEYANIIHDYYAN